jgi:ABC-type sugar transport system ATPase subunit
MLQIETLVDRKPRELSGGQRQRVAIARAIVREPKIFLFDEPLSNLDAALRAQTRLEIIGLHRALGATMIYVTHDQVEAMTLADRMVVLRGGHIEQVGPPAELYHRPATLYVAGFLGSPTMNFLTPTAVEAGAAVLASGERLAVPAAGGEDVATIGVRPEDVQPAEQGLAARIALVEELGETRIVHARLADKSAIAFRSREFDHADIGRDLRLSLPPDRLHLFDAQERRVG